MDHPQMVFNNGSQHCSNHQHRKETFKKCNGLLHREGGDDLIPSVRIHKIILPTFRPRGVDHSIELSEQRWCKLDCPFHIVRRHWLLILRKHKFKYRRLGFSVKMHSDDCNIGNVNRTCEQQREKLANKKCTLFFRVKWGKPLFGCFGLNLRFPNEEWKLLDGICV